MVPLERRCAVTLMDLIGLVRFELAEQDALFRLIARGELRVHASSTDDRVLSMSEVVEALADYEELARRAD